jgi:diguanylate cyclase (GGDEF)-like protein
MAEIQRASAWEIRLAKGFGLTRLESLRDRIIAFAIVAALVPSLVTAFIAYDQNRRSLDARIREELRAASEQGSREVGLWVGQRVYDLKVFAASFEIAENLRSGMPSPRVREYLNSVRRRVGDHEEIMLLDLEGRVITSSREVPGPVDLPETWLSEIRNGSEVMGEPFQRQADGRTVVMLAVPILREGSGTTAGALAARLTLGELAATLDAFAPSLGALSLLGPRGTPILRVTPDSVELGPGAGGRGSIGMLGADSGRVITFENAAGERAVGTLRRIPRVAWVTVAEISEARAFEQVRRLRNTTLLIVLAIMVGVSWIGYRLGLLIVRPLDRLAVGASQVAGGDLSVDLPVIGSGEVAYLTQVFNDMVKHLREGREQLSAVNEALRVKNEELGRLSVTDQLTGLFNRRRLMEELGGEVLRSKRHEHAFSILVMDVDHFKKFNDAYGHLAGDRVLAGVGDVLRETTREIDCPARYGGEEFVAVLPETKLAAAVDVAERIRETLATRIFEGRRVTLSIGVAEYPVHGETAEALIAAADAALYQAKHEGRNRVITAGAAA